MKAITALLACLAVSGCARPAQEGAAAPPRTAATAVEASAGAPTPFRIAATDRGFEAPARMSAGLRHIVFENHGAQVHEAMLVKLPPGMDADGYVAAVRRGEMFPEGALDYSGPGLTAPGGTFETWQRVDPGRYVLICWNGDHPGTVPVHGFTVVDDDLPDDAPPREDAVLRQADFHFELSGRLEKGMRVIRVETPGPSMHEVDLFRLLGGHTVADLNHWRKREDAGLAPDGEPPAVAMGGLLDSHDIRRVAWMRLRFEPGRYVFFCEMPMPGDAPAGLTHADVGMAREIAIAP
jgi:hypothetical protein